MDTFIHYGLAAGIQAVRDAGLEAAMEADVTLGERIGVCIGSGIGGLPLIEETHTAYDAGGPRKISPFFVPGSISNMISGLLSIQFGFKGPNFATVSACATANHSIGESQRLIEYGDADIMIAGGAEATVSPLGIGGFTAPKALVDAQRRSRRGEPSVGCRPRRLRARRGRGRAGARGIRAREDARRADLRGAGRLRHERRRVPHDGAAPKTATARARTHDRGAAQRQDATLDEVDYINAHGTSTPLGDIAETIGVKRAFGEHAKKLAVWSTKSMTGHLLGAAGGIEAVFTTMAIVDQVAPPTINLVDQDPQCDLDYVPLTARPMKIDVALSNAFGFGGTNSTLFQRFGFARHRI